ncbi:MAG: 16S rRNA (adenine(1518)-N(6)/adenine(1519)-N(6))-dimethyltransferase RsmA [bacterium]|nr:16S rRNA (adenine(1518)-N(6)/adenine(1519)-N(6))-dimethyltransferase RsmA [bacterium]
MDLYSIKTIKELLEEHKTSPNDRLGQNFLTEKRVASKMLTAAELKPSDTVLEVGPGIGTLTLELVKEVKEVVAVEKDPALVEILKETLRETNSVKVVQGDILETKVPLPQGYKVVANLPYYLTSHIIRMFLEREARPQLLVLMVQKEVAQRICAKPPDMSLLAVSVQFHGVPTLVTPVRKTAFWPQPKVDSAIIKIVPHKEEPPVESKRFFAVVKAGFSQPRKQLANNLASGLKIPKKEAEAMLEAAGISPSLRAETLSLADWMRLTKEYTMEE